MPQKCFPVKKCHLSLGLRVTLVRIASVTSKNIGIIHVDRHADIQEKDLDERMHTTPYFHATNIPNVPPKNLVQIGIGGWQVAWLNRDEYKVLDKSGCSGASSMPTTVHFQHVLLWNITSA